ncbi:MAG: hypothetical protein HY736_27605 [Verrucomicrobia bacterium]|nr:hypothetical protein [Verrucomicrobiota bacterium]
MQSKPQVPMTAMATVQRVGLALVATPHFSVEKRHAGERRPYTLLHRFGLDCLP